MKCANETVTIELKNGASRCVVLPPRVRDSNHLPNTLSIQ